MPKRDARDLLPLTPAVLHVLLALADGERHGYAVAQAVEELTDGESRMGPGTLYGSIQRMLAASLIEEAPRRGRADDDPRRRYYRTTPLGRRALELEVKRMARLVAVARSRRLGQDVELA